jgi:hypothetical protein
MDTIHNKNGDTVAWLKDGAVYDESGEHRLFIKNDRVFNSEGEYLGVFKNGFFRDKNGEIVAFTDNAENLPILPTTQIGPAPTLAAIAPIPDAISFPQIMPDPINNWSDLSWEEFVKAKTEENSNEQQLINKV